MSALSFAKKWAENEAAWKKWKTKSPPDPKCLYCEGSGQYVIHDSYGGSEVMGCSCLQRGMPEHLHLSYLDEDAVRALARAYLKLRAEKTKVVEVKVVPHAWNGIYRRNGKADYRCAKCDLEVHAEQSHLAASCPGAK